MKVVLFLVLVLSACSTQYATTDQIINSEQEMDTVEIVAIEKALSINEFKQYLHLEISDRGNLVFYSPYSLNPRDAWQFNLFSEVVSIITEAEVEKNKNCIVLSSAKQSDGNDLKLTFDYQIEGVFLYVLLRKTESKFEVVNYKITEH